MDETDDRRPMRVPPVIESASATTSPDNARSGPVAYVVTALVVGLLALFTLNLSSCVSAVGQIATTWGYARPDDYGYDHYDYYDYYDSYPDEDSYSDDYELYDEYLNELYDGSPERSGPLDGVSLPTSSLDSSPSAH
jgi:hypothetical protein